MVSRLGLILFTALFLFGCVSYSSNKITADDYSTKKTSSVEDKKSGYLEINPKITNQKEAVKIWGEPIEKNVYILEWNIKNKPFLEYVENWKWENSSIKYLLFNKEGKVHDKINIIVMSGDYNKVKGIKDLRLND